MEPVLATTYYLELRNHLCRTFAALDQCGCESAPTEQGNGEFGPYADFSVDPKLTSKLWVHLQSPARQVARPIRSGPWAPIRRPEPDCLFSAKLRQPPQDHESKGAIEGPSISSRLYE